MSLVPPSSIAPSTVTVLGSVSVSNFPADQLVHFAQPVTVDVDNFPAFPADQLVHFATPVDVTVGNFPADQLVHGSVSQGTVPWVVDGSAVTQPVSADALPLPDGAATEETLESVRGAANDVGLTAILQRERMATE